MRGLALSVLLAISLCFSASAYAQSFVKGHIDRASYIGNKFRIRGWACQTTDNRSIDVHIYAGGKAGQGGRLVGNGKANLNSEAAVAKACSSSGTKHRFDITIAADKAFKYSGQKLYVHGISPRKTGNLTINKSGVFALPTDFKLSYLKGVVNNKDVIIKSNQILRLDDVAQLRLLRVNGKVVCTNNFTLQTQGILVSGSGAKLVCGTNKAPFTKNGKFVLVGDRNIADIDNTNMMQGNSVKSIVAMNNGAIILHGKEGKSGYVKLNGTVYPGARKITLDKAVGSWQVGDQIVIASTDFDPSNAEKRTITGLSSNKRQLTLNTPLSHKHWGATETHSNGTSTWTLDERAEVINLSRNIKITSGNDNNLANQIGAHVMVMGAGSAGYIKNVELTKVGQAGRLGRYPFHWHEKGNVNGQYFTDSSIHDSFNRCVVIHGTNGARVQKNSCYNHFGHGYFLENGTETDNIIQHNIGLVSRKVEPKNELLVSEVQSPDHNRFPAPATFWISNPKNDVRYNVAAGSEGTGFWMSFRKKVGSVYPQRMNTTHFSHNIAHSSVVGITHDGAADGAKRECPSDRPKACQDPNNFELLSANYTPAVVPRFEKLVAYKNALAGIYYRGSRATYNNNILADNGRSAWFAFDQDLTNSLVVGYSKNHDNSTLSKLENLMRVKYGKYDFHYIADFRGMLIYDGPFYMDNVHFAGFPNDTIYDDNRDVTPSAVTLMGGSGRYTNVSQNVTFAGSPAKKITFNYEGESWEDSFSATLIDRDGSLVGSPQSLIIANKPINSHSSCIPGNEFQGEIDLLICRYRVSHFRFGKYNKRDFDITRVSPNGSQITESSSGARFFNKFPMIQGSNFLYRVSSFDALKLEESQIEFTTDKLNEVSPVIHFEGMPSSCKIRFQKNKRDLRRFGSLNSLKAQASPGYFRAGTNYYLRVIAEDKQTYSPNRRSSLSQARTNYDLVCNG